MWEILFFIDDNRWFSVIFYTILVTVVTTILSSFILYNYVNPEYDLYSYRIGYICGAITFIGLYFYTENYSKNIEKDINQEREKLIRNLDLTKCMSCTQSLSSDTMICANCGFDNTKISKKIA